MGSDVHFLLEVYSFRRFPDNFIMFRPLLSAAASPLRVLRPASSVRMMSGDSDKAGAVREAGGAFGKKEKAAEDKYFREQQLKQLENLKKSHGDEIAHHEEEIKRHQEAIARHKAKMQEMDK